MVWGVARHICQVAHFCSDSGNRRDNPGVDERGSWLLQRPERRRSLTRTFYEFEMECRDGRSGKPSPRTLSAKRGGLVGTTLSVPKLEVLSDNHSDAQPTGVQDEKGGR
jgi:hypothetical protein